MQVKWDILFAYLIVNIRDQGDTSLLCINGFTLHDGVCYKPFTTPKNWEDAESECNKLPGGHLAAFHSREDYNILTALMGNDSSFWIGGKYSGRMVFTDGSSYIAVPIHDHDNICHRIRGNNKVDGRECDSEIPYICQIKTNSCNAGYTQYQDYCFKLFTDRKTFGAAESACVALGGHLAAWRSLDEYDVVTGLTSGHQHVWIGAMREYIFSDNSTFNHHEFTYTTMAKHNADCMYVNTAENQVISEYCHQNKQYICQSVQYMATHPVPDSNATTLLKVDGNSSFSVAVSNVLKNEASTMLSEVALDLNKLFDGNITSCIPTLSLLGSKDLYSGMINFSKYNSTMYQESIGLRVTFNGMVNCGLRKTMYTKKDDMSCSTIVSCALKSSTTLMTNHCEYQCPCDHTGCDVTYVDAKSEYHMKKADVCEIEAI